MNLLDRVLDVVVPLLARETGEALIEMSHIREDSKWMHLLNHLQEAMHTWCLLEGLSILINAELLPWELFGVWICIPASLPVCEAFKLMQLRETKFRVGLAIMLTALYNRGPAYSFNYLQTGAMFYSVLTTSYYPLGVKAVTQTSLLLGTHQPVYG